MALQNLFVTGLGLLSGKSVWNHFIAALAMFNEEMESRGLGDLMYIQCDCSRMKRQTQRNILFTAPLKKLSNCTYICSGRRIHSGFQGHLEQDFHVLFHHIRRLLPTLTHTQHL